MKVSVVGYSGSGKSTLAEFISEKFSLPLLFLDKVQFEENWKDRSEEQKVQMVDDYLLTNNDWVIDGTYTNLFFERRMNEADLIIFLNFNRFSCFFRALKRYTSNRNKARSSIAVGCIEKMDFEFIKWLWIDGRSKNRRENFKEMKINYQSKIIEIKNQKQLNKFKNSKFLCL